METQLKNLIGKKVKKIFLNQIYLKFETDNGNLVYRVKGDCCSSSYFFDFFGVKNLLENGKVLDVKSVDLEPRDLKIKGSDQDRQDDSVQVYGYQIITESERYGEVTSVFSFRNVSNGYYGGDIREVSDKEVGPEITKDIYEVE